jgi:hypothetical protein
MFPCRLSLLTGNVRDCSVDAASLPKIYSSHDKGTIIGAKHHAQPERTHYHAGSSESAGRNVGCKAERGHDQPGAVSSFAREIKLTEEEWSAAIGFLTEVGHTCTDRHQEFILLSDTLGCRCS